MGTRSSSRHEDADIRMLLAGGMLSKTNFQVTAAYNKSILKALSTTAVVQTFFFFKFYLKKRFY